MNKSESNNSQQNKEETIKNWQRKLNDIQIPKTLMNKLVLNFLIVEGYKEGAKKFLKETGMDLNHPSNSDLRIDFNEELMDQRMQVRKFILAGKIKQAIYLINEINPQILDSNQRLNFELRKQQLIEIIKSNKIEEAIRFAQTQIAPKCQSQFNKDSGTGSMEKMQTDKFQRDLEQAMTLLIFEQNFNQSGEENGANSDILSQLPQSLKNLIDYSNRQRLASHVNEAILEAMGYQSEHKLGFYWQMTQWSQKELQKKAQEENIGSTDKKSNGDKNESSQLTFPVLNSPMGDLEMEETDGHNEND